jgi:hypothetical protein
MGLVPVRSLDAVQPRIVELGFGLLRGSNPQAVDSFTVSLGIASPLGLGDGGFQSIDTQGHRTAADEEQAIEARPTWGSCQLANSLNSRITPTPVVLDVKVEIEFGRLCAGRPLLVSIPTQWQHVERCRAKRYL